MGDETIAARAPLARWRPAPSALRRGQRHQRHRPHKQELHVAKLIEQVIRLHKLTEVVREHRVYVFWNEMVEAKVATNMFPASLSKGVLQVHVRSSVWVHESRFFRESMIAAINRHVGSPPLLSEIRFSLGTPQRGERVDHDLLPRRHREEATRRLPPCEPPTSVSQADRDAIRAQTSVVEDDDLRAVIEGVRLAWNR
jgi:hypothetical protein